MNPLNPSSQRWIFVGAALMLALAGCGPNRNMVENEVVDSFIDTKTGESNSETIDSTADSESYALPLPEDPLMMDYYLSVPDDILTEAFYYPFYPTGPTVEARQAAIEVVDETNYYLKLIDYVESGGMSTFAMTLFLKPDGIPLVAMEGGTTAGALSFRELRFFEVRDGEWVDVTEGQLPAFDYDTFYSRAQTLGRWLGFDPEGPYSFYMELPRSDTDLVLIENTTGQAMARVGWREGAFYPKSFKLWFFDNASGRYEGDTEVYSGHVLGFTLPWHWEGASWGPDLNICPEDFYEGDPEGLEFCYLVGGYNALLLNDKVFFSIIMATASSVGHPGTPEDYVFLATYEDSAYYVSQDAWNWQDGPTNAEWALQQDVPSILETVEFLPANPF